MHKHRYREVTGLQNHQQDQRLCRKLEDWEFSSFNDYYKHQTNSFLVKGLAFDLIGVNHEDFYGELYQIIEEHKIRKIFAE